MRQELRMVVGVAAGVVLTAVGCANRHFRTPDADASEVGAEVAPDAVPDAPLRDALPDAMDAEPDAAAPDVAVAPLDVDADAPDVFDADAADGSAPDDSPAPDVPGADVPGADAPDVPSPCPTGQMRCADGMCIDQLFSDAHCGGCDRAACPSGRTCRVGRCVVVAPDLALGGEHSCAHVARPGCDHIYCWGADNRCALGPQAASPDGGVADAGAADASIATLCAESVSAGDVTFRECSAFAQQNTARMLADFGAVLGLAAGTSHTCALVDDPALHGTVYCWGSNGQGQIGDGTRTSRPAPTRVALPPSAGRAVQVAAGLYHTCALTAVGEVYCWGENNYGELGTTRSCGAINCRNVDHNDSCFPWPTRVEGLPQSSQLAVYGANSCALTRAGTVMCWGDNTTGQLGVPNGADGGLSGAGVRSAVVRLSDDVVQVAAGPNFACALTTRGTVACWGSNGHCGLGTRLPYTRYEPEEIADLGEVTQIATGGFHVCALRGATGDLWCWGYNAQGQLGVPSTTVTMMPCGGRTDSNGSPVPIRAAGLADAGVARQVAIGQYHTCVINDRGQVWCWGYDSAGQLGDNLAPVPPPHVARPVIGICP